MKKFKEVLKKYKYWQMKFMDSTKDDLQIITTDNSNYPLEVSKTINTNPNLNLWPGIDQLMGSQKDPDKLHVQIEHVKYGYILILEGTRSVHKNIDSLFDEIKAYMVKQKLLE